MTLKTIGQMIKQIAGLADTQDASDWENQFIKDILQKSSDGNRTSHLSSKQVECIERLYRKHFA